MENINYFNKFAHEIKNPLTVCNGYLDMILKCNEKDKETYLKIIREEIKRTLNIINDYSNPINKDIFNIDELFLDIKNTLKGLYKDTNMQIISNNNLSYLGDYSKLKQVFINLIKNSCEANSSIVVINIEEECKNYKISIIDNGIGIKNTDNVYLEYYTTKINGTGLGIPYSKEIIELHNGSIKYYSKEDVGTRVEVVLPK